MTIAPRLWPFILCCGGMMCVAIASNLPPVYLTTFSDVFGGPEGLSEEQLGRIGAVVFAGFLAGILATGPVADRWGAKGFVLGGMGLIMVGLGVLGCAASYAMVLVAVFLLGLGAGSLEVVLSPIVAALQPHRRAAAMNWLHSFYCIGAVGVVLVSSAAIKLEISWRLVSLGMIVFPACLLAGFVFVKAPRLIHEDAECETMGAMLRHPFFLATLAVIALGGAMEIGMVQWLPAYAERGLGYPKDIAGASLAAFSVSMVVGRVLVGFLIRHVGAIPIMLVCCAASAALILTGSFATSPPVALTACVVLGFTGACFWPTTLGLAGDRFPRGGASMYGMLSAMGNTGCIVMPWVVGVVAGQTRLNLGLALVAVCPLFMALILTGMSLARKMRRDA